MCKKYIDIDTNKKFLGASLHSFAGVHKLLDAGLQGILFNILQLVFFLNKNKIKMPGLVDS